MKYSLYLFIFLTLFSTLTTAQSSTETDKPSWFSIEVIAFSQKKNAQLTEKWPPNLITNINAEKDTHAVLSAELDPDIIPISKEDWTLSKHAYSLSRSSSLTIQSHQAWHQKGLDKDHAPWVPLLTESENFSGRIQISLARYLHANIELTLTNPDWLNNPSELTENTVPQFIHVKAHRRMKSGTLHFIDHPLAGILIKIERDKNPAEDPIQH